MRIRTLKPEFWSHPVMMRQTDTVRLAAIGLLNMADDEGYLSAEAAMVRSALWPLESGSGKAHDSLAVLQSIGYIEIRGAGERGCIAWIPKFREHQRVDRPKPSKLREHFDSGRVVKYVIGKEKIAFDDESSNDRRSVVDPSTNDRRSVDERSSQEGKGREGKGTEKDNPVAGGSATPPAAEEPPAGPPEAPPGAPEIEGLVVDPPAPGKPRAVRLIEREAPPTKETWDAYTGAFFERYHVEPTRNARVSGMLAQFVKRVGMEDAPHVAAFYCTLNQQFYVGRGHPIELLLKDAETLHVQWKRGRGVTATEARMADKTAARGAAFGPMLEEVDRGEG